jgi:Ca2+-transporting ATPase
MMLDPKNLDTLEDIGGIEALLDGLGTTADMGLNGASLARSTTGLSGFSDGRPGAGVGVSHRHDPEKGEKTVPAITLTDPEGEKSTNWTSAAAFAASLDIRRRIYGGDVLPRRASKSLLSLMYTALKDKILVCWFFFSVLKAIQIFDPGFAFNCCRCFAGFGYFSGRRASPGTR